jgi:hypothetical protein
VDDGWSLTMEWTGYRGVRPSKVKPGGSEGTWSRCYALVDTE